MKRTEILLLSSLIAIGASALNAANLAGRWQAEFDSPIGLQKYLFVFQVREAGVTAHATSEAGGRTRDVEFKEAKLSGDTLTMVETRTIQNSEVRIEYTGKVGDSEIQFTRKVGDFGTQEFAAKRIDLAAAAATAAPNATPGDRPARRPGGFGGPIVLGPDDKPAFPEPPQGFNV